MKTVFEKAVAEARVPELLDRYKRAETLAYSYYSELSDDRDNEALPGRYQKAQLDMFDSAIAAVELGGSGSEGAARIQEIVDAQKGAGHYHKFQQRVLHDLAVELAIVAVPDLTNIVDLPENDLKTLVDRGVAAGLFTHDELRAEFMSYVQEECDRSPNPHEWRNYGRILSQDAAAPAAVMTNAHS